MPSGELTRPERTPVNRFGFLLFGVFMTKHRPNNLAATKHLMGALVRMAPKPHEEMSLKPKAKKAKSPARKRVSASAKNA